MGGYISNKKTYILWMVEKIFAGKGRATRSKSGSRASSESPRETPPPRSIGDQRQDSLNSRRRQEGGQVRHRWCEECIQVNHDSRYATRHMLNTFYLIIASEGRSQGRMKQRRHKGSCIRQDQESTPACEDQKDD
jgi:hypothetical protein